MIHNDVCTCTTLHGFCYRKHPDGVLQLIDNIKNIDKKDCLGRTPLMCVFLLYRKIEKDVKNLQEKLRVLTEILLERGVNPNIVDENGNNILHIIAKGAIVVKNEKVLKIPIRLLLEAGTENEIRNKQGMTPYDIAFRNHAAKIGIIIQLFTPIKPSRKNSINSSLESPSSLSNSVGSYDDVTSTEDETASTSNESSTCDEYDLLVSHINNNNNNNNSSLENNENNSVLIINKDEDANHNHGPDCIDKADNEKNENIAVLEDNIKGDVNNTDNLDCEDIASSNNDNGTLIDFATNEKKGETNDDKLPSIYKDSPISENGEHWVMIHGNNNQR